MALEEIRTPQALTADANPTDQLGGETKLAVHDSVATQLLGKILAELKITNLHLAMMHDTILTKDDING